ncbi:MAG TPA: hypothetical protein VFG33_28770 [Kribbella sp.]|uniref:hypothetical protein n=1 Tax=Kribbella sp. TaxID=1871183 RepID=UPI002D775C77|nr:hypothetical protein [Kribbella sp.]HET6297411.1 hypothetical protein [Kribbella sp.]
MRSVRYAQTEGLELTWQRLIRPAAAGSALVLLTAGLAVQATATPAPAPRSITWAPCEELPTMSCGTITLPVDGAKPQGATFELAMAKRPADDPANSKGPLFINPGGPGGSGVSYAFAAATRFSPDILWNFDIIGIDPRGVARSHPVVCSSDALGQPGYSPGAYRALHYGARPRAGSRSLVALFCIAQ